MLRALSPLLLFTIACAAMFLLGYCAFLVAPTTPLVPIDAFDSILLPNTVGVAPEPRDMFLFVATLLFVPLVLAGVAIIATSLENVEDDPGLIFWAVVLTAVAILVIQ